MIQLWKAIFLECWYQDVLSKRCPYRTKLTRKAFVKAIDGL